MFRQLQGEDEGLKKIIVSGATSMIGTALIEEAVQRGTEVYALIRPGTNRVSRLVSFGGVHLIELDLSKLDAVKNIPEDCDIFYHFAWVGTGKNERNNPAAQEKNIQHTLSAVDLAHRCGCEKFIGAGSQAEYGRVEGIIDSRTRFAPETAYGICKYAAGLLSRNKCEEYGITHIWSRIFSVYGRYDNEGTMIDYAIQQFLKNKEAVFSSGTQMWNYLYEKEAGRMFYLFGEKCRKSTSYIVADKESKPLREYILEIAEMLGAGDRCRFTAEMPVPGLEADISETCADIGYTPKTKFREAVREVIEYYKHK